MWSIALQSHRPHHSNHGRCFRCSETQAASVTPLADCNQPEPQRWLQRTICYWIALKASKQSRRPSTSRPQESDWSALTGIPLE